MMKLMLKSFELVKDDFKDFFWITHDFFLGLPFNIEPLIKILKINGG